MSTDIFHFRFSQLTKHTRINYGYRRYEESSQKLEEGHPDRKVSKKNRGKGLNLFILLLITANAEYLPYAHSNRET